MKSFRHSLAAQFFAAFALVAVLVIATLGGLLAFSMRDGFSRYLLQGELVRLDKLVEALSISHDANAPGWPELQRPDAWHRLLLENYPMSPRGIRPALPAPPPPGAPARIEDRLFLLDPDGREIIGPRIRNSLSAHRPIPAQGTDAGEAPIGYVGLTAPRGAKSNTDLFFLRGQNRNLLLASLFALALSAVGATVLSRRLLRPIKALEEGARRLANGDFEARIVNDRTDELGRLIDHTNAMAESLQASRDAERQWISDTSHELMTPLAVLRAEIEAMQDGIRKADDRTLAEMHDSVMRLSRLVADLRTLSFSREGHQPMATRPTDLAALVTHRLDYAEGRVTECGLVLRRAIEGPLQISCDPDRMGQVIDNLVENALRYTVAPGEIRITARREGDQVVVLFDDSPPQPPAEAMPHLFKRFYRAEESRSRELGGSGLGLSICAAIVDAHGGTIGAAISPLGGLRVRIALPTEGAELGTD